MSSLASAGDSIWSSMLTFQVPPAEKVIRTVVVYLVIALLIRVAGKRTLAQMNVFDLVVVLLLSNVVQNAVIGADNSLVGGVLGAVVLVAFNAVVDRVAFLGPRSERLFEGTPTVLVRGGRIDEAAMRHVGLRDHELRTVLHQQGADAPGEVALAEIQPGGTVNVELMPEHQTASSGELRNAVVELTRHLDERLAELESRLSRPGR